MKCAVGLLPLALGLLGGSPVWADGIPPAWDFQADAAAVRADGRPLMVLVSQHDCGYCEKLKQEIIRPMILSGDYEERVLIRELSIDAGSSVRDFSGAELSSSDFARNYKEKLTPTLLFLGPDGEELVPRMRGLGPVEFYGVYVDRAIAQARSVLAAH